MRHPSHNSSPSHDHIILFMVATKLRIPTARLTCSFRGSFPKASPVNEILVDPSSELVSFRLTLDGYSKACHNSQHNAQKSQVITVMSFFGKLSGLSLSVLVMLGSQIESGDAMP